MDFIKPYCIGCGRNPDQIQEYIDAAENYGASITPDHYVRLEEGTFNSSNGHFACTDCYIKMGEPSSPRGWRAP